MKGSFSKEEDVILITMFKKGFSVNQIMDKLDRTKGSVKKRIETLRKLGIDVKKTW